jgi:hypothetical protein
VGTWGNYTTRPAIQGTDCIATWGSVDQDLVTRGEPKGESQDNGVRQKNFGTGPTEGPCGQGSNKEIGDHGFLCNIWPNQGLEKREKPMPGPILQDELERGGWWRIRL